MPPVRESLRGSLPADEVTGALAPDTLGRASAPPGDGLFGSVELPVRGLNVSARWAAILAHDPAAFFLACGEGAACRAPLHRAYEDVSRRHADGLLGLDLLRDVNRAVNGAIRWQTDLAVWGSDDYWAEPAESAAKGAGDCEDYAIAKYGMLAALGVAPADMRITVVKDTMRGIGHAVLAVRAGDVSWILDNQSQDVRPDRAIASYMPLYSVSAEGAWIHGTRRGIPVARLGTAPAPASEGLRPTLEPAP